MNAKESACYIHWFIEIDFELSLSVWDNVPRFARRKVLSDSKKKTNLRNLKLAFISTQILIYADPQKVKNSASSLGQYLCLFILFHL